MSDGNTIRVLDLRQHNGESDLHGNLRHVSLFSFEGRRTTNRVSAPLVDAKPPYYEALSYVWGEPNSSRSLHCATGKIALTSNLETALKALRHHDRKRAIWVNAICIDQKNVAERGHQVKLMGKIYANAERVLIWLGPDPQGIAQETFKAIRNPARRPVETKDTLEVERAIRQVTSSEWLYRL